MPSAVATSMAKLFVSENAKEIVLACQQYVMGAYGYAHGFNMERIVRDVLSFARDTRVQAVDTSAAQVFEIVIEDCESVLVNEGVAIHIEIHGACLLAADSALLAQALTNLVRNAAEAMRGGARRDIVLGAREARLRTTDGGRRDFVVLSVEDSGPGIPAEARERIFNPFFTTRAEGTGLGLAIVHRIIDAHGGMTACTEAVNLTSRPPMACRLVRPFAAESTGSNMFKQSHD